VILRGPHFQILGVAAGDRVNELGIEHKIEAVALNANRDHLSAIASNEGVDREMRDLFRAIVVEHRSTLCADYCDRRGARDDAAAYRELARAQGALIGRG
jgi:hypothetical protein